MTTEERYNLIRAAARGPRRILTAETLAPFGAKLALIPTTPRADDVEEETRLLPVDSDSVEGGDESEINVDIASPNLVAAFRGTRIVKGRPYEPGDEA